MKHPAEVQEQHMYVGVPPDVEVGVAQMNSWGSIGSRCVYILLFFDFRAVSWLYWDMIFFIEEEEEEGIKNSHAVRQNKIFNSSVFMMNKSK